MTETEAYLLETAKNAISAAAEFRKERDVALAGCNEAERRVVRAAIALVESRNLPHADITDLVYEVRNLQCNRKAA